MNTHDIDLPDLPEHFDVFTDRTHSEIRAYALAAIEADRQHFAELFMDLNRYANGMYEQEYDPYMEGVADGYGYAAEFLLGNRNAAEEIEADRQRRGEPVGEAVIDTCEHGHKFAKLTDLPVNNQGHPSCVHCLRIGLAKARAAQPALDAADLAFIADELRQAGKNRAADLVLTAMAYPTQPAEPVKVPSDDDIRRVARDMYLAGDLVWLGFDKDENGEYTQPKISSANITLIRALLARYGGGQK